MHLAVAGLQPQTAAPLQRLGLRDLLETEHAAVERARIVLGPLRDADLCVMQALDAHGPSL
ncbi:hypothetical protein D3C83_321010 [compost metagenome]